MITEVISVGKSITDNKLLKRIQEYLLNGDIISFPTETVYGLGAIGSSLVSVDALYTIKNRDRSKPLGIYIHTTGQLSDLKITTDQKLDRLINAIWPGPVTLLITNQNGDKLGIRFSENQVIHDVLQGLPTYIVGTSANMSGAPDCLTAHDVFREFNGKIPLVIDGGITKYQKASSIIDVSQEPYVILRKGAGYPELKRFLNDSKIEYTQTQSILIVCTGNTCRSPMVEAYLRKVLAEQGINGFSVKSCGVYAPLNMKASPDAVSVMQSEGMDISDHVSKNIDDDLAAEADKVLVMTGEHQFSLLSRYPQLKDKILVLDIVDPIGRGAKAYNETLNLIKAKIKENLSWIVK
jgi:protein-tyrosine phosphatase